MARDAAPGDAAAVIPELPGTLWYVEPHALIRLAGGKRTRIEGELFPSRSSLPDGRLVALASKGDGSADSEQLALVGADGTVSRIGPTAPTVREPAVDPAGRFVVLAINQDGHSDLYRLELATEKLTRLTNDKQGNFTPALAAGAIVFASSRDGDSEIIGCPSRPPPPSRQGAAAHRVPSRRPRADPVARRQDDRLPLRPRGRCDS